MPKYLWKDAHNRRHVADPCRIVGRRARVALTIITVCLCPHIASAQTTVIGAHPRQAFPDHIPRPIKIDIGFYLVDFARINGREETFDMQGYLTASWVDPALARKPGEPRGERRIPPDRLWTPNYEFINAAEQVKVQNEAALVVNDVGRVTQRFRFVGKFSWPMNLRRFPFDRQVLNVLIEPFEREQSDVVFQVDREHVGRLRSAFLSDWSIPDETVSSWKGVDVPKGVDAHVESAYYKAFNRTNSRLVVEIHIVRKSMFYAWRVLLPLALLVFTSWLVFRFDPTNLQPLISTTVAILLNVILFNFTIDFALPKVSYPTFIDTFAVTSFFFMLLSMHLVTWVHITCLRKGVDTAQALQKKILRYLPLAYPATVALEFAYFLL